MVPSNRLPRAGLLALALLLCAGEARAQYVLDDEVMPPRAVAWRLADRGFTGISRPRFDGRAYVVEAFAPDGGRVRLFVDAGDGAILGRQRLDAPPAALPRPMPGYGWTEEDALPRRPMRQAERLVPPADIPMPDARGVPPRRNPDPGAARPEVPGRAAIDANPQGLNPQGLNPQGLNPQGLNPDARGRGEPQRRVSRIEDPERPHGASEGRAATRAVPQAPRLKPVEAKAAGTEPAPKAPVAAIEAPKPAAPSTPAAVQPPAEESLAKAPAPTKPQTWTDPPEGKRTVRVIGGATVVPGTADKEPGAAQ